MFRGHLHSLKHATYRWTPISVVLKFLRPLTSSQLMTTDRNYSPLHGVFGIGEARLHLHPLTHHPGSIKGVGVWNHFESMSVHIVCNSSLHANMRRRKKTRGKERKTFRGKRCIESGDGDILPRWSNN